MITRREAFCLGCGTTIAALTGTTMIAVASPAPAAVSGDLAILIEAHRAAYAALTAHADELGRADAAFFKDRKNPVALRAKEIAHRRERESADLERKALVAMLSHPCRDLHELRIVVAIAKETWWTDSNPDEEEFNALLAGILGGGA